MPWCMSSCEKPAQNSFPGLRLSTSTPDTLPSLSTAKLCSQVPLQPPECPPGFYFVYLQSNAVTSCRTCALLAESKWEAAEPIDGLYLLPMWHTRCRFEFAAILGLPQQFVFAVDHGISFTCISVQHCDKHYIPLPLHILALQAVCLLQDLLGIPERLPPLEVLAFQSLSPQLCSRHP